jgi:hypothetical protein
MGTDAIVAGGVAPYEKVAVLEAEGHVVYFLQLG